MAEVIVPLFVFFGGGLAWLAWNHPKAYETISPYLVAVAFAIASLIYGLQTGFEGAVEKLRSFLSPAGLIEAEKLLVKVNDRTLIIGGLAFASGIGMSLLGGLRFLPRGRD